MEEIKSIKSKLSETISKIKNKKVFLIVLLGICGIFLIFLSELFPENDNTIPKKNKSDIFEEEPELEVKLEEAVSKISGAIISFCSSEGFITSV